MPELRRDFASDNTAGMCPEALDALAAANAGHVASYGEDRWTQQAADGFRALFGCDCDVYFTFNGTAANALSLAALCQPYQSVVVAEVAHVETDECGAPEFFSNGAKLLAVRTPDGRLRPADLRHQAERRRDIHYPRPRAASLTNSTELGTLYRPAELAALSAEAHALGMRVHCDGARFANAVAALGVAPAELAWRSGIDVLCFGGTKNGIGLGEAVVFFDRSLSRDFDYRCKQAGQLASKMRFLAAPWAASLASGSWLANARRANACAARLAGLLAAIPGVRILHPVEANVVFCDLPETTHARLEALGWRYYRFIGGGARFMCSWATSDTAIDELAAAVRAAAG
jgi:threonine aldolase